MSLLIFIINRTISYEMLTKFEYFSLKFVELLARALSTLGSVLSSSVNNSLRHPSTNQHIIL